MWAVPLLIPYLEESKFTPRIDHPSLPWIPNLADGLGILEPCRLQLLEYDLDIVHRSGIKHQVADTLWRVRTHGEYVTKLDDCIPCLLLQEARDQQFKTETLPCVRNRTGDARAPLHARSHLDCRQSMSIEKQEHEIILLAIEEFIHAQSRDTSCQSVAAAIGRAAITFDLDRCISRQTSRIQYPR